MVWDEREIKRDLRIGATTNAIEVKVKGVVFICACNPLFQSEGESKEEIEKGEIRKRK